MITESQYKSYSKEEYEELFSNFLISSWSYSKLSAFSRHEKAFEMNYIFGIHSKSSSVSMAGKAYHHALNYYFSQKKLGVNIGLVQLEQSAFAYIDEIPANQWKLQKTLPTVEECKAKATKAVTLLLKSFTGEIHTYEDDIDEVLAVELYCAEFLVVNGVDIPLPCHAMIDLVVRTKSDKIVIIDHKSVASYTGDDEIALSIGEQAITYVKCYEEKMNVQVDEVWFIENKTSENKDKSQQMHPCKVPIDDDTRRLYEAMLYESLRRMIDAVSDPDYVYLINKNDNFVDLPEVYEFWARTMIAEVEDFNIDESKKPLVAKRLKKIRDASVKVINPKVIKNFKENASKFIQYDISMSDMTKTEKIEHVLRSFGTIVKVAYQLNGYSSDTFLLEFSAGVKIASIYSHRLDLANALDVPNVRMTTDLVMHEGRSYLGLEVSKKREHDLIFNLSELQEMRIPLGKDNFENTIIWDLNNQATPHALVCGATGSGKSVLIRSTVEYAKAAGIDDIVILDPKFEFMDLAGSKVSVYNDVMLIEAKMSNLVVEMNTLVKTGKKKRTLIVFDEFADAVANSRSGKELDVYEEVVVGQYANGREKTKREKVGEIKSLEENLRILLQKGRSTGYRIIAATQRASVKVITGDAKVNFPVQICFRVPKEADSRVVLDESGAESLAGRGDGLIKSPEYKSTVRFQAFYKPVEAV
jgi:DNA segregation ATPase FtsK/SpoIIIE, S-DNA-T family